MLPDEYLAQNIAAADRRRDHHLGRPLRGARALHGRTTSAQLRADHPGVVVLAHPECPPEVVAEADFAGSTAAMIDYVGAKRPARVVLLTECSMSDNVAVQHPDVEFMRPCNLCPHMKRITLPKIRRALETDAARGDDRSRRGPARPGAAVERMLEI